MTVEVYDNKDFGVFSVKWMLRNVAKQVPRADLEESYSVLVTYLDGAARGYDTVAPSDALDMAAQVLLTGEYHRTIWTSTLKDAPFGVVLDVDDLSQPNAPTSEITEDEIQRSIKRWDEVLDSAQDPFEGFKL